MDLPWPLVSAGLLAGLAGGVHCAGMCGGIVTALSAGPAAVALGPRPLPRTHFALNTALSHTGRIGSYVLLGTAAGSLGSAPALLRDALPVQMTLYLLANLALAVLGLHLAGAVRAVPGAQRVGQAGWQLVRGLIPRLYPVRGPGAALALGAAWGWMPCGLVYSVLALALISASASGGALIMLAFGLGTLPHLLLAGYVLAWAGRHRAWRWLRQALGLIICLMALIGFVRLAAPRWAESLHFLGGLCLA